MSRGGAVRLDAANVYLFDCIGGGGGAKIVVE